MATIMYLLREGGKSVFPFYEASHVRRRWRAPILAEPDQTPHITMWHYGCGRLLRCGCAGSMRREGYGGCAGAVVLGYSRSAPLNTAVECSSSPQHRGSKATCRPPSPGGSEKNPKVGSHRGAEVARWFRSCTPSSAHSWPSSGRTREAYCVRRRPCDHPRQPHLHALVRKGAPHLRPSRPAWP